MKDFRGFYDDRDQLDDFRIPRENSVVGLAAKTPPARCRDRSPGTAQSLAPDESQQVGIDGIGLGGRHAVRKTP
jgi:hypothetical protein